MMKEIPLENHDGGGRRWLFRSLWANGSRDGENHDRLDDDAPETLNGA